MIENFKKGLTLWLKNRKGDIILFLIITALCLLFFALGYITAKIQEKIPLKFEGLSLIKNFSIIKV